MLKRAILLATVILALSTSVVFAQNRKPNSDFKINDSTTSGLDRARQASGKQLLPEVRQKNVRALFERMLAKFEVAVVRVEGLIEKIEARILSLSEVKPDLDLTTLEQDLASAKEYVESAKVNLENSKVQIENVIFSDTPGEEFKELRLLISQVKDDLQATHRLLVKIVNSLRRLERITK